jgi:regulator of sigma E protease
LITLISFVFVFSLIAITHELGHLIAAKRAGIDVYEFALGFGPRVFGIKTGKTAYALNLFPVGGYVRIAGIDPEHDEKETPEANKYYTQPIWNKFRAIIMGPLANLLLGYLIIYFLFLGFGIPKDISNVIEAVSPGSEAEKIGLQPDDQLITINARPITNIKEAIKIIHQSSSQPVALEILRNRQTLKLVAQPKFDKNLNIALIGFSLRPIYEKVDPLSALWLAGKETGEMVQLLIGMLCKLIIGQVAISQLAGPIGIAQVTGQQAQSGLLTFLSFIAFFSINVSVFNLLPLPALDGGRLVFILIEFIRRKAINIQAENKIHSIGLACLLGLILLVSINDVARLLFFKP